MYMELDLLDKEKAYMKLQPLKNRVIVKEHDSEEIWKGIIYIPETARKRSQKGTVLAIGTDEELQDLSEGDVILYNKYAATDIRINGEDYVLVIAPDILAKEENA